MFRSPRLLSSIVCLSWGLAAASCGDPITTSVGPSAVPKCQVAVTGSQPAVDAAGGAGSVTVSAAQECGWTAVAGAPWISGVTPAGGQGNGEVKFQVGANPTSVSRQAEISVNDVAFRVTQAGAACRFEVTPASRSLSASGGTGTLTVATLSGCAWTVTSSEPWLSVTAPSPPTAGGTGPGSVTFSAAANVGGTRSATLIVGGQTVVVTQSAPNAAPCTYLVQPDNVSVPHAGAQVTVAVQTGVDCSWSASSTVSWLTMEGATGRTGGGTFALRASANGSGAARTGRVDVGDQTLTVTQAASTTPEPGPGPAPPCSYTLDPSSQSMSATGGSTSVRVQTGINCSWSATSDASWLTVDGAGTGLGTSDVSVVVAANAGAARTGAIRIATTTFTVSQAAFQAGPCAYAIDPTALTFSADSGTSDPVSITTSAGCAWTAVSHDGWIDVETGAQGTGSGTMTLSVSRNRGKARTGTLTVAGHTLTVTQQKN